MLSWAIPNPAFPDPALILPSLPLLALLMVVCWKDTLKGILVAGYRRNNTLISSLLTRERSRKKKVNTENVLLSLTNTMLYCTVL